MPDNTIRENSGPARESNGRWKAGVSGNPKGKPLGTFSITDAHRKYYQSHPEIFEKFLKDMRNDPEFWKSFWSYVDVKPTQSVDITSGGKPLYLPAEIIEAHDLSSSPEPDSEGQT